MRIGVIGINHKLGDIKLREKLARSCLKRFSPGNCTHGQHSFILLSTCNRMELYFSSDDLAETHSYVLNVLNLELAEPFDQKLYSFFGNECFYHLAKVTAGLDSAIVAETEIQGQVKGAYELACSFHQLPSPLHFLFQKSLKIAKDIRTTYDLGRGMPNIEHAIFQTAKQVLKNPEEQSILFIGTSEINLRVLDYLHRKGCSNITICNRTEKKAENTSLKFQIPHLKWEERALWPQFEWVIVGTKAPTYLLTPQTQKTSVKLVMDLSFPRNVDPLLKNSPLHLLNIEEINNMLKCREHWLNHEIQNAEKEIDNNVKKLVDLFQLKTTRQFSAAVA